MIVGELQCNSLCFCISFVTELLFDSKTKYRTVQKTNKCNHCLLRVTMETNALQQSAHERDLAPLFGDLSQSEKLSEIKLPLSQSELMEILLLKKLDDIL